VPIGNNWFGPIDGEHIPHHDGQLLVASCSQKLKLLLLGQDIFALVLCLERALECTQHAFSTWLHRKPTNQLSELLRSLLTFVRDLEEDLFSGVRNRSELEVCFETLVRLLEVLGHLIQFRKTPSAFIDGDCFLAKFDAISDEVDYRDGGADGVEDARDCSKIRVLDEADVKCGGGERDMLTLEDFSAGRAELQPRMHDTRG
jgi:hypothetical protein